MANTELHAAQSILERGVRARVRAPLFLRLIGIKHLNLTLRRLYAGTLFHVSELYLMTGITEEELKEVTAEKATELMSKHGKTIAKAVACALLNGRWRIRLFSGMLGRYLMDHMAMRELVVLLEICLIHNGTSDFMNCTRYLRAMKITDPSLGQKRKGS